MTDDKIYLMSRDTQKKYEEMFDIILDRSYHSPSYSTVELRGKYVIYNTLDAVVEEMYELADDLGYSYVSTFTMQGLYSDISSKDIKANLMVVSSLLRVLSDLYIEPETIYNLIRDNLHKFMISSDAEEYIAAREEYKKYLDTRQK